MNASAKPAERHPRTQDDEPAKGGINPPHETAYPSGDTPKPHGDKFQHALDEAAERKKAK
jgi:hypothetical protein